MTDRLTIALRLKAGRYLAGEARDGRAVPISTQDLAASDDLVRNRVTQNRIEDIEQMRVDARPMELERIAAALNLSSDWFSPAAAIERELAAGPHPSSQPRDSGSEEDGDAHQEAGR